MTNDEPTRIVIDRISVIEVVHEKRKDPTKPYSSWSEEKHRCISIYLQLFGVCGLLISIAVALYQMHRNDQDKLKNDAKEISLRRNEALARLYSMDNDTDKEILNAEPEVGAMLFSDKDGSIYRQIKSLHDEYIDGKGKEDPKTLRKVKAYVQFRAVVTRFGNQIKHYLLLKKDAMNPVDKDVVEAWDNYIRYFATSSYGFISIVKETESTWTTTFQEQIRPHYR